MLQNLLRAHRRREHAFTLIEVIVAVVVLGILATIAIPGYGQAQRSAIVSSIKSDIRNSVNAVLEQSDSMLEFTTPDHFDEYATVTNGNSVTLFVDGDEEQVACIWGSHAFGENDVESFYWSSDTGTIGSGTCIGLNSDVITGGYEEGVSPNSPSTDPGSEEGTGDTGITNPPPPETDGDAPPGVVLEPTAEPNEPEPTPAPGEEGTGDSEVTPVPEPEPSTPPATEDHHVGPPPVEDPRNKYPVCHNNNGKKSYNLLMLPLASILSGHTGDSHQGGKDIIPPISHGRFAGQHWNPAGIAIFQTYCT